MIANWKCNGTTEFVRDIVPNLINDVEYDTGKMDFIVLPGMLHINLVKARAEEHVIIGAQNVSSTDDGAFTGEVSAQQLADYAIEWVLIGHTDRRTLYGDTQKVVNEKIERARENNMGVIYCVGETLEERTDNDSELVINNQLDAVKECLDKTGWNKVIIAYEPIWAVNTGKVSSGDQT